MNPKLEQLIMLQDLDLMISELSDPRTTNEVRRMGFSLEPKETLEKARADQAARVDAELIAHYAKLQERYKRAIVPVKNNTCLACFLKQPTQFSTEQMDEIRTCDHCSRILYLL